MKAASVTATTSSVRVEEVRTSNQASTNKSVAVAVAAPSSQGERRQAATATVSRSSASATSKPAQAISQCAAWCVEGNAKTSRTTQGTSNTAASPKSGTTQRAGRQPLGSTTAAPPPVALNAALRSGNTSSPIQRSDRAVDFRKRVRYCGG